MHVRIFTYSLARADRAIPCCDNPLARQPGYRGRIVIAGTGEAIVDWQFFTSHEDAIAAWPLLECALTNRTLTGAIQLAGEGALVARNLADLRFGAASGMYGRAAMPHYPPGDPPDAAAWAAILRAQPGYCGQLAVDAGYGRLLTLALYDSAASYCAARDSPAAQRYIATELAPRWTAPTRQIGAGAVTFADLRCCR